MARVKKAVPSRARRKNILGKAKGYRERNRTSLRVARQRVDKGWQYAYRDRRVRKRNFRALWIQRINACAREHGLTYSQFINGIKLAGIEIDRKQLAELAVNDDAAFTKIVETARTAIAA